MKKDYIKNQFVTYEIALKLKELGFNERCFAEYTNQETLIIHYPHECFYGYCHIDEYDGIDSYSNSTITAPIWQQAIDFVREKHKINIMIAPIYSHGDLKGYVFNFGLITMNNLSNVFKNGEFKTYEDAREQAILKAIELIKK